MPTKTKHKYKEGEIVYCRPWVVSGNGMSVFKCEVIEAKWCVGGKTPHYSLKIIDGGIGILNVKYENEISKKPQQLVKQAKKAVEEYYCGYIQSYNDYLDDLNKLK